MASRLSQMQARFQQKQMQEKEEKLLRLYENQQQRAIERVNRGSAGSNTSATSITSITSISQGGKVRQMFDERRQKAGIDRSYPLEPLNTVKTNGYARGNSLERLKNDNNTSTKTVVKTVVKRSLTQTKNGKPVVNKNEIVRSIYNNNDGDENYEEEIYEDDNANEPVLNRTYKRRDLEMMMNDTHINENIDDEEFPEINIDEFDEPAVKPKLSNVGGKLPSQNGTTTKKPVEQKVFVKNSRPTEKTNTVVKKETKETRTSKPPVKRPVRRTVTTASSTNSPAVSSASSNKSFKILSPTRTINKSASETMQSSSSKPHGSQKQQRAPSTGRPSSRQSQRGASAVTRDDLSACRYCSRRFATDRLATHEDICAKTAKKKRKTYDATKHRVQGTELEPYTRKLNRSATASSKQSKQAPSKKGDWRRKHEEFISTIRAAKEAQQYVAKGGKLSDLPPPPPSYNPDYVECPHCGRRFNESAAQRHIPKCATYDFNKSKSQPKPGGRNSSNRTR